MHTDNLVCAARLGVVPPPARGQRYGPRCAGARGPGGVAWAALRELPLAPGSGQLRMLTHAPPGAVFRNALRASDERPRVRIMPALCALALGPLALG